MSKKVKRIFVSIELMKGLKNAKRLGWKNTEGTGDRGFIRGY